MANPDEDQLAKIIEYAFKEARKEGLSVSDAAQIVADVVRAKLEQRAEVEGEMNREMIHLQSIFGAKSGLPLVDFKYGLEHFTLDVDNAREHALDILQVAEAASQDAALFRFLTLTSKFDLSTREAADAVGELRRFRGDVEKEDWRTADQKKNADL